MYDKATKKMTCFCNSAKKIILWVAAINVTAGLYYLCLSYISRERAYAQRELCVGNLNHIRVAKALCTREHGLLDGSVISHRALEAASLEVGKSLKNMKCPNGGVYVIGRVGVLPQCSYTNICYTWEWQRVHPWLIRRSWTHSIGP